MITFFKQLAPQRPCTPNSLLFFGEVLLLISIIFNYTLCQPSESSVSVTTNTDVRTPILLSVMAGDEATQRIEDEDFDSITRRSRTTRSETTKLFEASSDSSIQSRSQDQMPTTESKLGHFVNQTSNTMGHDKTMLLLAQVGQISSSSATDELKHNQSISFKHTSLGSKRNNTTSERHDNVTEQAHASTGTMIPTMNFNKLERRPNNTRTRPHATRSIRSTGPTSGTTTSLPTIRSLTGRQLTIPCSGVSFPTLHQHQHQQQQQQQQLLHHNAASFASNSFNVETMFPQATIPLGPRRHLSSVGTLPAGNNSARAGSAKGSTGDNDGGNGDININEAAGRHLLGAGVSLIVWHKDDQLNSPIFVVDSREIDSFRHAKQHINLDSFKGRAHLELISTGNQIVNIQHQQQQQQHHHQSALTAVHPALVIDDATVDDSAIYTCSIEFHKAPTQIHRVQANVIDPPKNMLVYDETASSNERQKVYSAPTNIIGPHDEDSNLVLNCEVELGKPANDNYVTWWQLESVVQIVGQTTTPLAASVATSSSKLMQQLPTIFEADYITTISLEPQQATTDYQAGVLSDVVVMQNDYNRQDETNQQQQQQQQHFNQLVAVHQTLAHLERAFIAQNSMIPGNRNNTNLHEQQFAVNHSQQRRLVKHWRRLTPSSASENQIVVSNSISRASLEVNNLSRMHANDEYLCLANNNNFSIPLNVTVKLNMNLKPTEVRIINKTNSTFKLGQKAVVECQVFGSKPSASISWLRGSQQLKLSSKLRHQQQQLETIRDELGGVFNNNNNNDHNGQTNAASSHQLDEANYISEFNRDINNNLTKISYLTLIPRLSDNQLSLTCSATNPKLIYSPTISDAIVMNVQYAPRLNLQLNSRIQPDSIRVGSDIFMECTSDANPQIDELNWLFNDSPLSANVSAGIIMSNQSLVLQRIRLEQRGTYQCFAQNSVGKSVSNKLNLRPKFAPVCDYSLTKRRYEIPVNHATRIECNVLAEPGEDLKFYWYFNQTFGPTSLTTTNIDGVVGDRSSDDADDDSTTHESDGLSPNGDRLLQMNADDVGSSYHLEELRQFETNFTMSSVIFEPKTRRHYGQLLCSASNSIDKQEKPCIIQVLVSELPDPVINCFTDNQTQTSFSVHCQPSANTRLSGGGGGSGHGLHYILELYLNDSSPSSQVVDNDDDDNRQSASSLQHLKSRQPSDNDGSNQFAEMDRDDATNINQQRHKRPNRIKKLVSETPSFHVNDLRSNSNYYLQVFVQNSKGISVPTYHQASTRLHATLGNSMSNSETTPGNNKGGRVEFFSTNKRNLIGSTSSGLDATDAASTSSHHQPNYPSTLSPGPNASLSAKLISYLKIDNYLPSQLWQESHPNHSSSSSSSSYAATASAIRHPLISIGLIILLCLLSILVLGFFVNKLCLASATSSARGTEVAPAKKSGKSGKSSGNIKGKTDGQNKTVIAVACNGRSIDDDRAYITDKQRSSNSAASTTLNELQLLPDRLSSSSQMQYGSMRKQRPSKTSSEIAANNSALTAANALRLRATLGGAGSGSDTSRETNTDSTLISSPQTTTTLTTTTTANDAHSLHQIRGTATSLQQQQLKFANCYIMGDGSGTGSISSGSLRPQLAPNEQQHQQHNTNCSSLRSSSFSKPRREFVNNIRLGSATSTLQHFHGQHHQHHDQLMASAASTSPYIFRQTDDEMIQQQQQQLLFEDSVRNDTEPVYIIGRNGLVQTGHLDAANYHQLASMSTSNNTNACWPNQRQGATVPGQYRDNISNTADTNDVDDNGDDNDDDTGHGARCQIVDHQVPIEHQMSQQYSATSSLIPNSFSIPVALSDRLQVLGRGSSQDNCCNVNAMSSLRMGQQHQQQQQHQQLSGSYLTLLNSAINHPHVQHSSASECSEPMHFQFGQQHDPNCVHDLDETTKISVPPDFVDDYRRIKQTFQGVNQGHDQGLNDDDRASSIQHNNPARLSGRRTSFVHVNDNDQSGVMMNQYFDDAHKASDDLTPSTNNQDNQVIQFANSSQNRLQLTTSTASRQHRVKFDDDSCSREQNN